MGVTPKLTRLHRWDEGLLNMAPGEKRLLTIQPEAGYGSRAMGPIPSNSVLSMWTDPSFMTHITVC